MSGFEMQLRSMIIGELSRAKHHGPKRDVEKIMKILNVIWFNDSKGYSKPLSTKELKQLMPGINENTLEDYLQFLRENPPSNPFLIAAKEKRRIGGPVNVYKINPSWRSRPRPIELEASMRLELSEPGEEPK